MCEDYSNNVNIYTELKAYLLQKIETHINKLTNYWGFCTFDQKSAYNLIPLNKNDKPFIAFETDISTSLPKYRLE